MKDYYYILGLKKTASLTEVKKAYRKLSIKFHPDHNDGDKFFEERFKDINEAYETLSNEYTRNTYDEQFTQNSTTFAENFKKEPTSDFTSNNNNSKKWYQSLNPKEIKIKYTKVAKYSGLAILIIFISIRLLNTIFYRKEPISDLRPPISSYYVDTNKIETTPIIIDTVIIDTAAEPTNQLNVTNDLNGVNIGSQYWSTKNLNIQHFRNGDEIPEARSLNEWRTAGEQGRPAWCYFKNDPANGEKYGKLYNWYAVSDPRGLAPVGWHIPSQVEWSHLIKYLGGESSAYSKVLNPLVFKAVYGGTRGIDTGKWWSDGQAWWSSSECEGDSYLVGFANIVLLNEFSLKFEMWIENMGEGISVRCIKD